MDGENLMTVFPNPAGKNDLLNIQLTGFQAGTYKISMVSASAQTVNDMAFNITSSGSVLLIMPSAKMAAGSYEVIVTGNNQQYSKQLVITNR